MAFKLFSSSTLQPFNTASDILFRRNKIELVVMIILGLLTLVRFYLAAFGHLSEIESYLALCSRHLDWGFVEGPAGIPAIIRVFETIFGNHAFAVRFLSSFLLLGVSWILWCWITALRNKETAFWTVIILNVLPLANAAGTVMEGTMLVAYCWLVALWIGWRLITSKIQKNKISSWCHFGFVLALGTQVTYQIGWLLPLVAAASLNIFHNELPAENEEPSNSRSSRKFCGIFIAALFLVLSWMPLLWWNQQHYWLQFQNKTWDAFWSWPPCDGDYFQQLPKIWSLLVLLPLLLAGACCFSGCWNLESPFFLLVAIPFFLCVNELGHGKAPFGLILVMTVLVLPIAVEFFMQTSRKKMAGACLIFIFSMASVLLFFGKITLSAGEESAWNFPSSRGVVGTESVSSQLIQLRSTYMNTSAKPPFLIAETPGLAAILGAALPIQYPERPEAPSVFVSESPALTNQFQLWPHYADATTTNEVPDPLYTEEKAVSPFLGYDAFYITTERLEEIPQTITGAFTAVIPLSVTFILNKNGRPEQLNLYLCQNYQMLSL